MEITAKKTAIILVLAAALSFVFLYVSFLLGSSSKNIIQITPSEGSAGTKFFVIAEGVKNITMKARVSSGSYSTELILFDDGTHGDVFPDDGVYSNLWSSDSVSEGFYEAVAVSLADGGEIELGKAAFAVSAKTAKCVELLVSGRTEDKVNVVFIGSGYASANKLKEDALIHMNAILSVVPFNENRDKFNFYYVTTLYANNRLGCGDEGMVACSQAETSKAALQCPNTEVMVLVNTTALSGSADGHAYVGRLYPEVTVHEFGHIFGPKNINLYDEYSYERESGDETLPPNCDVAGCPKWAFRSDVGCFNEDKFGNTGCSYINWWKPVSFNYTTGNSIMEGSTVKRTRTELDAGTKISTMTFNPISEEFIRGILGGYK